MGELTTMRSILQEDGGRQRTFLPRELLSILYCYTTTSPKLSGLTCQLLRTAHNFVGGLIFSLGLPLYAQMGESLIGYISWLSGH